MENLNRTKSYLAIIEFIAAVILTTILFPIGLLYSFILPFKKKYKRNRTFFYFKRLVTQIWYLCMLTLHQIAYNLDLLGNVIVGELIEDLITKEENTWFGSKKHTLSQSFGKLLFHNNLNSIGIKLVKIIDSFFGKNHCLKAYLANKY